MGKSGFIQVESGIVKNK